SDTAGSDIGGLTDTPGTGAGNLISGNTTIGVFAAYGLVQGNLIGADASGTHSIGNGRGAFVGTELVGGTTSAARNVISGNLGDGVFIASTDTVMQGNYVGVDITGTAALKNHGNGVSVVGSNNTIGGANNTIGDIAPEASNVIAFNQNDGVWVGGG